MTRFLTARLSATSIRTQPMTCATVQRVALSIIVIAFVLGAATSAILLIKRRRGGYGSLTSASEPDDNAMGIL